MVWKTVGSTAGGNTLTNIYGDGSEGSTTINSNTTYSGAHTVTTLEINSGVTVDIGKGLFVQATEQIVIDGSLNGTNNLSGGSGGWGERRTINEPRAGGDGESGTLPFGVSGGDADSSNYARKNGSGGSTLYNSNGVSLLKSKVSFEPSYTYPEGQAWAHLLSNPPSKIGHAGGGGVGGYDEGYTNGADGGDGGAGVVLLAPDIRFNGTLTSTGQDGSDPATPDDSAEDSASGGAGGGGAGGSLFMIGANVNENGTYSLSGGAGGVASPFGGVDPPDGEPGDGGKVKILDGTQGYSEF